MRLTVCLYIFLLFSSPALAYVEENNIGLAETSAGDQYTNIHILKAMNDFKIKELKKNGSLTGAVRGGKGGLSGEKDEHENEKMLEEVVKLTANPQALKNNVRSDVFISLLSIRDVKDAQVAAALQKQLNGARR